MEERQTGGCLPAGTLLRGRYRVAEVVGTGGFGITYRALDLLLDCDVAVKEFFPREWVKREPGRPGRVLLPGGEELRATVEECRRNFRREAGILAAVRDVPYIVRLRDEFEQNGTEYIVLNLISGRPLSKVAEERGGTLPAGELLSMMRYTFDTLSILHEMGFIHRDISPGNLMLSEDGVLFLIDFGSASAYRGHEELQSSQIFSHRGLEPPEHARLDLQGPWTDIYSLCATIVYLVTGEGIVDAADRRQFDYLPQLLLRSSLSSAQQNALIKGLNPDIGRRFSDVSQLYFQLYGRELSAEGLPPVWRVRYHARTVIGTRRVNQDNFMVDAAFCYKGEDCEGEGELRCAPDEIHVVAACDGVGGCSHGELAAKAAIQAVIHFVEAHPRSDVLSDRMLEELLDQVNEKILQLGEKIGMTATTIALFLWRGDRYYAVNIGDSPIYLLHKGRLSRLSSPHTRAALRLARQEPVAREDYNTLTRYLGRQGVSGSQMAAFRYGRLSPGDVVLVCTDGVTKRIDDDRLGRVLSKRAGRALPAMFQRIMRSAENDNCTAIVLNF